MNAGESVGRGFFGCLGALAAGVVVIVALFALMMSCGAQSDKKVLAGTGDPAAYASYCAAATSGLSGLFRNVGVVEPFSAPPLVTDPSPPPTVRCLASSGRGTIAFTIQVQCTRPLEDDCHPILSAERNGQPLKPR